MDGFFLYYMKSAFTMLKYRVFSYDANERILFMKLGSGMYKEIARDALKGNWMKAIVAGFAAGWLGVFSSSFLFIAGYVLVAVILVYFLEFLPGFYPILFLGTTIIALIYFFIGGVIRLGYIDFNLALLDRRKNGIYRLGSRMSDWWRVLCAKITLFFALSLGYVLLIAPGIITKYSYAMVPYILEERPDFTVHEAFKASKQIMKKHKWELFCLRFSFIGWDIIGILTLGIGLIFINPYRYAAEAAFYNEISGRAEAYYGRKEDRY